MVAKSKRAKYVLPNTVNPATSTGYCVPVPDDIQHLGAFLGQLKELSSASSWQDDPAHTAKDVANVWRAIFDNVLNSSCEQPFVEQGCQSGNFSVNPYQFQSYNPPLSVPNVWQAGVGWLSSVDGTGRSRLSLILSTITDTFTSYSFQIDGTLGDAYTATVQAKLAGVVVYNYNTAGNLPATLTQDPAHPTFTADTIIINVQLSAAGNTNPVGATEWKICYIGKPPIVTSGNIWEIAIDFAANDPRGIYDMFYGAQGGTIGWIPGTGYGGRCIYEAGSRITLTGDATSFVDWYKVEGTVETDLLGYVYAKDFHSPEQRYYGFSGYIFPTFPRSVGPLAGGMRIDTAIGYFGSDCDATHSPYAVWLAKVTFHGSGTPPTLT